MHIKNDKNQRTIRDRDRYEEKAKEELYTHAYIYIEREATIKTERTRKKYSTGQRTRAVTLLITSNKVINLKNDKIISNKAICDRKVSSNKNISNKSDKCYY